MTLEAQLTSIYYHLTLINQSTSTSSRSRRRPLRHTGHQARAPPPPLARALYRPSRRHGRGAPEPAAVVAPPGASNRPPAGASALRRQHAVRRHRFPCRLPTTDHGFVLLPGKLRQRRRKLLE
uniref:Uncharacterized protein n=1 Tax=Oryza rufipogon TaxID=4529 RepID=A0A0E0QHB8_ORYRU